MTIHKEYITDVMDEQDLIGMSEISVTSIKAAKRRQNFGILNDSWFSNRYVLQKLK